MSNPHYEQEKRSARNFQARDLTGKPIELLDTDGVYETPEYKKSRQCGICGGKAWKKASVGTFVCSCGGILGFDGQWFKRGN